MRGRLLMKALEFETRINPDNTLTVPPEFAEKVLREQPVRVILLVPEAEGDDDEREWVSMAASEFLKGYAESDAIYDDLSGG